MTNFQPVYIGIKAYVVCLDIITGKEKWRTKIKRSHIISIIVEKDFIVAHAGGELFGLDKCSGEIRWNNSLPGLGYGYCFMATENSNSSAQMHNNVAAINSSSDGGDGGAGSD